MSDEIIRPRVPTLHKMAHLLRAFTPEKPAWRLQELATKLAWDVATTHRFVKALVDIRMLDIDVDGAYRIGLLPLELAALSLDTEPQRQELLRRMAEITDLCGLTTQIGVLEDDAVAIVASHESDHALRAAALLGQRLPLHATAAGKALLVQFSDEEIADLLPRRLQRFTDNTITDRRAVIEQVQAARTSGIACADSELSKGLYAIAIPIPPGHFGSHASALTCAGVTRAVIPEQWDSAEQALRDEAARFEQWHRHAASALRQTA